MQLGCCEQECTLSVHVILMIVLSLISHIYIPGVQIRTIGHTGEGNCTCDHDDDAINFFCPVTGHWSWVTLVAYSPDGKHVVSVSDDGGVRIWDSATGKEVSAVV